MTAERIIDLNTNTLIGDTDQLGNAWHWRKGDSENNHFPGAVPIERVRELLPAVASRPVLVRMPDDYTPPPVEIEAGIYVDDPYGMTPVVPNTQAIVRQDTGAVLGIFKSGYEIHQYGEWLVENVETILGQGLHIGSAGLLKGGAQAWVMVTVPKNITTPEGEVFRPNLVACTSHDGSLATTYKRVVTRVVCDNTQAAALGEVGQQLKIKHSKYSKLRIGEAHDALAMVHAMAEDYAAQVATLTRIDVSDKAWGAFLDAHAPLIDLKTRADKVGRSLTLAKNERESLTQLWNTDTRVSPYKNTAWGVLQAVNTHGQHIAPIRNVTRAERNMSNAIEGKTDKADMAAMQTLMKVLSNA